ncbi:MAG TPA: amidase [Gemmatimonadales bacterium]|nr:amidase [Gemmatimonadales bacterium]
MPAQPGIADLSASELRRLVGRRELSPVEVVEACLARVEQYNGVLNAVVTLNENAVDDARALEREAARGNMGPLCGLPVGIKDVTWVAKVRTTYGSPVYADHVPEVDALVVRRLREAGAVILGKTNCPEFAAGGNTFNDVFGRTRNPWNPERSAGGSTGGGAVALAAGMVALAEGTDLGGSLRIPASFCGLVGLRPSPGLVPTWPSDWLWDTLQVTGPIARTAEDVGLMLDAVAGPSPLVPFSQPVAGRTFAAAAAAGIRRGLRLAYSPDLIGIGVDPDVERACRAAAFELRQLGAVVEEVDINLSEGRDAFLTLRGLWFVNQMHIRAEHLEQFGPNVASNIRSGLSVTMADLAAAEYTRGRIREMVLDLLARYDHLVTPAMAIPPFPVEQNYPETVAGKPMKTYVDWIAPTFVLSLTGLPVGVAPCGLDSEGLPVGLQIVGRPFGEETVLALAGAVQRVNPIGPPPLDRLAAGKAAL